MTTITAIFKGTDLNLDMVLACGLRYFSKRRLTGNTLRVEWIIETLDYEKAIEETQDCINLSEIELWDCELISLS